MKAAVWFEAGWRNKELVAEGKVGGSEANDRSASSTKQTRAPFLGTPATPSFDHNGGDLFLQEEQASMDEDISKGSVSSIAAEGSSEQLGDGPSATNNGANK